MAGVIEVELVGGGGFPQVFLAILGPLFIAGAAVTAALVARRTANERQAEQLAHDTERQAEQLAHDTERQKRQLDHDREMRDREYLVETVSAAFENRETAKTAVIETGGWVGSLERVRTKIEAAKELGDSDRFAELSKRLDHYYSKVNGAMDGAHPATMRLWSDTARLRLVLGPDSPVVDAHIEMAKTTRAWYDAAKEGYFSDNRDEEEMNEAKAAFENARVASLRFEAACRVHFGWAASDAAPIE